MNMSPATSSKPAVNTADDLVRKNVFVKTTPQRAFEVFTNEMSTWWPLVSHNISKVEAKDAVVEPFVGGRWFERGVDGSECDWGHVLAWDPPGRVVLAWQLNAAFQHDTALLTEVEVRFTPENGGTRVDLEHRLLRNYGARAEEMKKTFEEPAAWSGILTAFASRAARAGD